jgi:excisionase family DNA binding protein
MHGIPQPTWYKLIEKGEAPGFFRVGNRVRISEAANREWLIARVERPTGHDR